MRQYLISSTLAHAAVLGGVLLFASLQPAPPMMIDGFDFMGTGVGGGTGGGGTPGLPPGPRPGPKAEQMGQVVPQPVATKLPDKAAPIQKAVSAEETWKVKDKVAPPASESKSVVEPVVRGDKEKEEASNIIRRGVAPNTTPGDGGFDFGSGGGGGNGRGVGIGLGDGEGGGTGGFGSYLRIVRQRIWSEWSQSAVLGSKQSCVVGLTIGRGGQVSDIRLEKSSGDAFYDTVAVRAVRNASPLPPLPEGYPRAEQRFRIQFRLVE